MPKTFARASGALAAMVALCSLLSCSLLLNFDDCITDADCLMAGKCMAGVCQDAERVKVTDHIAVDTTWTADKVYLLENLIMVVAPATLTIEAGTTVLGQRNTGLVSLAGAKLMAIGTRDKPIVFTSAKTPGQRLAGDWAGIGMVGRARVNRQNFNLRIITDVHDTRVGGSDDSSNCGTLRYVRIEFGGSEVDGQKALKGLTLAGCGNKTKIEYVQTHLSDDDGVGVFGGTVDLRYIVSTRARDDAFDFDTGWRGTAQFLAIQQDVIGVEAIEVENLAEDPAALPQTDARIYNYTMIGANRDGDRQIGLFVKLGGLGVFSHGIITGYKTAALVIDGVESTAHAAKGDIGVHNTLFFNNGATGTEHFAFIPDNSFDNYAYFEQAQFNNVFGKDPGFNKPYDLTNPGWVPASAHTTGREIVPPPEGFDPTAVYRGAFSPSATPWTEGWTSYPLN
ncbi:MAG: hypothetical protein H0U74_22265 [Bradymonadaceae bacterium]|nr:hypothetical protein [Lujinxingiaceae bacterium]